MAKSKAAQVPVSQKSSCAVQNPSCPTIIEKLLITARCYRNCKVNVLQGLVRQALPVLEEESSRITRALDEAFKTKVLRYESILPAIPVELFEKLHHTTGILLSSHRNLSQIIWHLSGKCEACGKDIKKFAGARKYCPDCKSKGIPSKVRVARGRRNAKKDKENEAQHM